MRKQTQRIAEMQYSTVHPKQTETAAREVESALATSTRVFKRRERDVSDAQKLCVTVFNGCDALLQQLTRAQKAATDPGAACGV